MVSRVLRCVLDPSDSVTRCLGVTGATLFGSASIGIGRRLYDRGR